MNVRDLTKIGVGVLIGALVVAVLYRTKPEPIAHTNSDKQPTKLAHQEPLQKHSVSPQVGMPPPATGNPVIPAQGFIASDILFKEIRLRGNTVGLTTKEMEQVKSAFDEVYLQRLILERQIALVTESNEHRVVIRIPSYSGTWLQDNFYALLAAQLSPEKVDAVKTHYGDVVAKLNEGFGNHTQDIEVHSFPDDYVDISRRTLADDGSTMMVTNSQLLRSSLDSYVELSSLFPGPTNN